MFCLPRTMNCYWPSTMLIEEIEQRLAAAQDQLETATRIRPFAQLFFLPSLKDLKRIVVAGRLPLLLAIALSRAKLWAFNLGCDQNPT